MSEGEYKILDTKGRFAQAVKDGRSINDVSWSQGRILLSNRRIIVASNEGKRTIPLSKIEGLGGRHDPNQNIAAVSSYLSLKVDNDVMLVSASDHEEFQTAVYEAVLDQKIAQAKHPAVAGGVVQDTEWQKARLKVEDDAIAAALKSGEFVRLDLDDISGVEPTSEPSTARRKSLFRSPTSRATPAFRPTSPAPNGSVCSSNPSSRRANGGVRPTPTSRKPIRKC